MVKIELERPISILKTIYRGMAIYKNDNIIYIHNNSKIYLNSVSDV